MRYRETEARMAKKFLGEQKYYRTRDVSSNLCTRSCISEERVKLVDGKIFISN